MTDSVAAAYSVTGGAWQRGPTRIYERLAEVLVARCQLHKICNVESKLAKALASTVAKKMRAAYRMDSALAAQAPFLADRGVWQFGGIRDITGAFLRALRWHGSTR